MTADRRPNLGLSGAASPRSVGPWADYRMFLIFDYYGVLSTRRTDSVYLVYFLLLSFLTFIWRTEDRRQPQNCRNAESSRTTDRTNQHRQCIDVYDRIPIPEITTETDIMLVGRKMIQT